MTKRRSYDMPKKILLQVKEKGETYTNLSRKINTNYNTIKNWCVVLEGMKQIAVETTQKDKANGRPSYNVIITDLGRSSLKRMTEK